MCRMADFKRIYDYDGNGTCAADGMCQEKCPVKINTGALIKSIRTNELENTKAASGAMVRTPETYGYTVSAPANWLHTVCLIFLIHVLSPHVVWS